MPDLYPKFDMPDLVEAVEDTSIAYPKSWLFDFDTGDFVLDGAGNVVEADGLTTWAQWCVKAVLTQRLAFVVYNWDYGVDIENVMKQPTRAVTEAELEKEITEALMTDPRTAEVKNFTFEWSGDELTVSFIIVNAAGVPAEIRVGVGYREVMREFSISKTEQTISDWLRGELVNVEPTEDGKLVIKTVAQPTFTRSSIAYKSDGSQVAADQPRFDVIDGVLGLMVEEGTTNLFTNPKLLNNGQYWTPLSATAWVDSSGEYPFIHCEAEWDGVYQTLFLSNTTYTFSYLVKHKSGSNKIGSHFDGFPPVKIRVDGGEWINSDIITVPSDGNWHLVEVQATYEAAGSYRVYLQPGRGVVGVSEFWFKYAQLEAKPYATSFIDGTRSPETLTIPTAGVLNPQEGTVECWLFIPYGVGEYDYSRSFLGTAHSGNYFLISVTRDGKIRFASLPAEFRSSNTVQYNNWNHVALRWDSQGRDIFLNGVKTSSAGAIPAIDGSLLYIGSGVSLYWLNGLIDDLRISNRARTDAEILSAYQSNQPLPIDENTTYALRFDNTLKVGRGGYRRNKIYLQSLGICQGSHIEWSAEIPTNTTAKVYTSLDDVNFTEAVNGAAIEGLSEGVSLSDKALMIKQTMTTEDASITPMFSRLQYSISGKVYLRG